MTPEIFLGGKVVLHAGDSRGVLKTLAANSIDSIVTDPPYALVSIVKRFGGANAAPAKGNEAFVRASRGFMGKQWDTGETAFATEFWQECLRVLKPGGFCVAAGGDRTVHRLACAIEDAGFEIRGQTAWIFGSGFPKSLNASRPLLALPWCSCGGCNETRSGAEAAVASDERASASCTDPSVSICGSLGIDSRPSGIESELPFVPSSAGVRAETVSVLPDSIPALQTIGLGEKLGGRSRHRGSAVESGIKNPVRDHVPIMLRPSDVAVMAEGKQIACNVSAIKAQPETLRHEMVSDQVTDRCAIEALPVALNDGRRDIFPSPALVGPLAAAPDGVGVASEPSAIVDAHTDFGAVDRGLASFGEKSSEDNSTTDTNMFGGSALEFAAAAPFEEDGLHGGRTLGGAEFTASAGDEIDPAMLALFGDHAETIGSLIRERKVLVCNECGLPCAPEWVIDGLGTALKPAMELFIMARKPLQRGFTVAANVLAHGVGAINVDGCRVDASADYHDLSVTQGGDHFSIGSAEKTRNTTFKPSGRWPANIIHDGSEEVIAAFPDAPGQQGALTGNEPSPTFSGSHIYGSMARTEASTPRGDSGSAARFFYTAKADADDRLGSKHPTVKPVDLMQWLCRLVTPPGGTVLDCFAGTGTTGEAAFREGFNAVLIEREDEYLNDIRRRMRLVLGGPDERARESIKARQGDALPDHGPLFAEAPE